MIILNSCRKDYQNVCLKNDLEVKSAHEEISQIEAKIKERVFLFDKKLESNDSERTPLYDDKNYLELMELKSKRDQLLKSLCTDAEEIIGIKQDENF